MVLVTVDTETRAKLKGLSGPAEFCDEQGRVLGRFVPAADLEPQIPAEELLRRAEHFQGRPLAELIAEWEQRK
jgi:hypothetical protein